MADELIDPNVQDDQQTDAPVGPNAVVPLTGSFENRANPIISPQFAQASQNLQIKNAEADTAGEELPELKGKVLAAQSEGKKKLGAYEGEASEERRKLGLDWDKTAQAAEAYHNARVAERTQRLQELDANAANAKPHEFWENKSAWDKVRAHIALGLGAFGAALAGTPNFYQERLQKEIDHHEANEKEAIDRKFKLAEMAAQNLKGTQEERDRALRLVHEGRQTAEMEMIHRQEMRSKSIADEATAQQLAAGVPLAVAQENSTVKGAEAQRAQKAADVEAKRNGMMTVQEATHQAQVSGAQVPKILTDPLTNKDLPVDPTRTDARKHNAAAATLPAAAGGIKIIENVQKQSEGGPEAPTAGNYVPGFVPGADRLHESAKRQQLLIDQMVRFRSAYGAAKHEPQTKENMEHLKEAIPDPPPATAPRAKWDAWRSTIGQLREELYDIYKGELANAGVHPRVIEREGARTHAPAIAAPHPSAVPVGQTKVIGGVTYKKVGDNNWQVER